MDPVALKVMQYYPKPNAVPNNAFTFQNNYFLTGKSASGEDKFDSRIDQNFSSKFRVFARGSYGYSYSTPFNGFQTIGTSSGSGPSSTANYNITANGIYTFNPTTILNVNYGFGRFVNLSDAFSQGTDPASLGFPKAVSAVAATTNFEFPALRFQRQHESLITWAGDLHDAAIPPVVAHPARRPDQGAFQAHDQIRRRIPQAVHELHAARTAGRAVQLQRRQHAADRRAARHRRLKAMALHRTCSDCRPAAPFSIRSRSRRRALTGDCISRTTIR